VKSVGFGFYGGKDQYYGMEGTSIYIVANFYPTPNIEGKFIENVPIIISQSWYAKFILNNNTNS